MCTQETRLFTDMCYISHSPRTQSKDTTVKCEPCPLLSTVSPLSNPAIYTVYIHVHIPNSRSLTVHVSMYTLQFCACNTTDTPIYAYTSLLCTNSPLQCQCVHQSVYVYAAYTGIYVYIVYICIWEYPMLVHVLGEWRGELRSKSQPLSSTVLNTSQTSPRTYMYSPITLIYPWCLL